MQFKEWEKKVADYDAKICAAESALRVLHAERTAFFRKTVGMAPGDMATLEGTVSMMVKVAAMLAKRKK